MFDFFWTRREAKILRSHTARRSGGNPSGNDRAHGQAALYVPVAVKLRLFVIDAAQRFKRFGITPVLSPRLLPGWRSKQSELMVWGEELPGCRIHTLSKAPVNILYVLVSERHTRLTKRTRCPARSRCPAADIFPAAC